METEIIGIDHGNAAVKTRNASFPNGITEYDFEPYTKQNMLEYGGKYYVCGSGRLPLLKDKTINDSFYLLTLAAVAKELEHRACGNRADIILAAGLATRTKPAYSLYEPSAESLRLESQINRNIAKPDDPAETVRLILQGIDARYRSVKAPPGSIITKKYDDENRLSVPDWDLFKEAVSHIYLSHTGIGLKTISGEEFYMERNDVNASGDGSCPAGSDGYTGEPPAE
jgi:hypothetical protein